MYICKMSQTYAHAYRCQSVLQLSQINRSITRNQNLMSENKPYAVLIINNSRNTPYNGCRTHNINLLRNLTPAYIWQNEGKKKEKLCLKNSPSAVLIACRESIRHQVGGTYDTELLLYESYYQTPLGTLLHNLLSYRYLDFVLN